jgi:LAGLIDADG endonuclease
MIQSFFGGIGTITINPKKNSPRYSVVGINDINIFIVKHFEIYPLQRAKKIDFDLWKECVNLIINKKDKTQEGLEQIVTIKSKMNLGLSNLLKK